MVGLIVGRNGSGRVMMGGEAGREEGRGWREEGFL